MIKVSEVSFEIDVLQSARPVLVNYWAQWCGPCRQLDPILDEVASEWGKSLTIVKLNIDNNPNIVGRYNILDVPTLMLFRNGRVQGSRIGIVSKSTLLEWIEEAL